MKRRAPATDERPSLVPPWAAALASLARAGPRPGAGPVRLARRPHPRARCCPSPAMMVWRIALLGHLQPTPGAMLGKAIELQPGVRAVSSWRCFALVVAVERVGRVGCGARQAAHCRGEAPSCSPFILFTFFALGWQISEIAPARLVTDFPQAMQPLGQVIWPWKAAVVREPDALEWPGRPSRCRSPPERAAPDPGEAGKPHLVSDAELRATSPSWTRTTSTIPGHDSHAHRHRVQAGLPVELWWVDPLQNAFQLQQGRVLPQRSSRTPGAPSRWT